MFTSNSVKEIAVCLIESVIKTGSVKLVRL